MIEACEPGLPLELDAIEIDGAGKWVFPGLVDMHVHLREPGGEDSETILTGLQAAIAGGITTVGVMPNTSPPMDTPESVLNLKRAAVRCGFANVVPVPCVTRGRAGREPVCFHDLRQVGAIAFTDDGDPVHDSGLLLDALDAVYKFDGVIIEHPEVTDLAGGSVNMGSVSEKLGLKGIPCAAETADVARCMEIASNSHGHLHLTHLSLPRSVELARAECFHSADVTIDVTPHHIALCEDALMEHGTHAKMNPPLRSPEHRKNLAEMVKSGMVDAIASDHAPHAPCRKTGSIEEAAFGIVGLETLLPVSLEILRGLQMPVIRILHLLTCGPARILGIPAPSLEAGRKADLVLFDPEAEYRLSETGSFSKSINTPFFGRKLQGRVEAVWIGSVVYRDGEFAN
ncbi:MAG: dihydroorotase [Candidatus Aegiribacteria sp.]|nr:dihydroorotase [Candidatus Aegiribacteria sp.]